MTTKGVFSPEGEEELFSPGIIPRRDHPDRGQSLGMFAPIPDGGFLPSGALVTDIQYASIGHEGTEEEIPADTYAMQKALVGGALEVETEPRRQTVQIRQAIAEALDDERAARDDLNPRRRELR